VIRLIDRYPVLSYCLLTFAVSWGYYGIYLLTQSDRVTYVHPLIVKQFSPAIAGLFLLGLSGGSSALGSLFRNALNWRVGWRWLLLSLLAEPLLFSGIILAYWAAHNQLNFNNAFTLFATPGAAFGVFLVGLIRWGFSEEVGWRGWLLPKLLSRYSPLTASLVISVIVTLWHLNPNELASLAVVRESPYLPGSYPDLVERLIITIPFTMLMNVIFIRSGGSLLAMMIFHSASNTSYFALREQFPELTSEFCKAGFLLCLTILGVTLPFLLRNRNPARHSPAVL